MATIDGRWKLKGGGQAAGAGVNAWLLLTPDGSWQLEGSQLGKDAGLKGNGSSFLLPQ